MHALPALRAELEPGLPVIGTVPAVKPAAAAAVRTGGRIAIWATPATTGSPYQRRLIEEFGNGADITGVPCHGLADAVESGSEALIADAVRAAAERTPADVATVVLGCTHYELVGSRIQEALRGDRAEGPALYGSAAAVCAQALRRAGVRPEPEAPPTGELTVLHSGRTAALPDAAFSYAAGPAAGRGERRPRRPGLTSRPGLSAPPGSAAGRSRDRSPRVPPRASRYRARGARYPVDRTRSGSAPPDTARSGCRCAVSRVRCRHE